MRVLWIVLISNVCYGQSLALGVKVGGRVTDDITFAATSESKRYTVGPMIDLGLPFGLGVEADALYSREGYNFANMRESGNQWEIPLLLKYRLPVPVVKPYADVGWAARVGSGTVVTNGFLLEERQNANWNRSGGLVIGGGAQFGIGRLRVSPEVRYTRWNSPAILVVIADGPTFESAQNEVDLLVGIGWKVH